MNASKPSGEAVLDHAIPVAEVAKPGVETGTVMFAPAQQPTGKGTLPEARGGRLKAITKSVGIYASGILTLVIAQGLNSHFFPAGNDRERQEETRIADANWGKYARLNDEFREWRAADFQEYSQIVPRLMRLSDLSGGRQAQLRTMPPLHETFDLLALEGLQEELLFYQDLLASNKRETRLSCALIERVMQLDRDVNANHPSSEDAQHKHTLIKTEVERMRTEVLTTLKNLAHSLAMLRGISDEHIRLFDIKEDPALTTSPPLNSVEYKQRRERILAKSKSLQNEWIALGTLARDLRDSITPYLTESERTPGK